MSAFRMLIVVCALLTALVFYGGRSDSSDATLVQHIERVAATPTAHGMFSHAQDDVWYQPLAVYPAALLRRMGVPGDLALTAPSLLAAYLVILLTHHIALRLDLSALRAVAAAALLLLTPGFIDLARAPGGALLLTATILGWCAAVLEYLHRPRNWLLVAGAGTLAVGVYSHPAGVWSTAVFFVFGAWFLRRTPAAWNAIAFAGVGVAAMLLPAVAWVISHATAYPDTFGRWAIHAAHIRNPLDGIVAFSRWHVAARRASDYWHYLSPTFLFASGQMFALWAIAVLPLGLVIGPKTAAARLAVGGFLLTPVAAVMLDVARTAALVAPMLAFGAVVTLAAIQALPRRSRAARIATTGAVAFFVLIELTGAGK